MKTDTITKDYVKDAGVFADIFNYYIYGGRQVILPEQLTLQRLRGFHLLDHGFFTKCFDGDMASIELILQIVLERPHLKV